MQFTASELLSWHGKWCVVSLKIQNCFMLGEMLALRSVGKRASLNRGARRPALVTNPHQKFSLMGKMVCKDSCMRSRGITCTRVRKIEMLCDPMLNQLIDQDLDQLLARKAEGKLPNNFTATPEKVKHAQNFLDGFAARHGLPDPGRDGPSAHAAGGRMLLSSSIPKVSIYDCYQKSMAESGDEALTLKFASFRNVWKRDRPNISMLSPRSDMCATSLRFRDEVKAAPFGSEREQAALASYSDHKQDARVEREFCNSGKLRAARDWASPSGGSLRFLMMSFDYAQQVLLPFYPDQAGALCFLTGRKVKVFGVANEGEMSQQTFLADE